MTTWPTAAVLLMVAVVGAANTLQQRLRLATAYSSRPRGVCK